MPKWGKSLVSQKGREGLGGGSGKNGVGVGALAIRVGKGVRICIYIYARLPWQEGLGKYRA